MTYNYIATPVDVIRTVNIQKFSVAPDIQACVLVYNTDLRGHTVIGVSEADFAFSRHDRAKKLREVADFLREFTDNADSEEDICARFLCTAQEVLMDEDTDGAAWRVSVLAMTLAELMNKRFVLVVTSRDAIRIWTPEVDDVQAFEAWVREHGRAMIVKHHNTTAIQAALEAHMAPRNAATTPKRAPAQRSTRTRH